MERLRLIHLLLPKDRERQGTAGLLPLLDTGDLVRSGGVQGREGVEEGRRRWGLDGVRSNRADDEIAPVVIVLLLLLLRWRRRWVRRERLDGGGELEVAESVVIVEREGVRGGEDGSSSSRNVDPRHGGGGGGEAAEPEEEGTSCFSRCFVVGVGNREARLYGAAIINGPGNA